MEKSRKVFAVDPGLHGCGCALFLGAKLIWATYVKNSTKDLGPRAWAAMAQEVRGKFAACDLVVVERQRVYPGPRGKKTDPNDLVDLSGVVGAIAYAAAAYAAEVVGVFPAEWKGQVPKEVMNARVLARLAEAEKEYLYSKDHNTLDAVGIGLYYTKRL
jgi:hypothetical protein